MADGTRTDPRYHAAYQRGYDGPAPELRSREEERFRRPRRPGVRSTRAAEPTVEAARPAPAEKEAQVGSLSSAPDPLGAAPQAGGVEELASVEEQHDEPPVEPVPPVDPAAVGPIAFRVPATLTVVGVVLVPLGLIALWWSMYTSYTSSTVYESLQPEQYLRMLVQFVSGPMLTVGLVSLAAAVVVQAVRRARA